MRTYLSNIALCATVASFIFFFFSLTAFAADPTVTSVSVTPSSASSGILRGLSWSTSDAFGVDMLLTCPTGVTVTINGSTATCGSKVSLSSSNSGSVEMSLLNVTGAEKQVYVRLYAKDSTGSSADASSLMTTISVSPVQNAISDFTLSTTTVSSGGVLTMSWESHYIPNINMRFECSNLQITAQGSSVVIPCGSTAFSSDLAANGSQSIVVTNPSDTSSTLTVVFLPAIVSGMYDGLNSKVASVTVLGRAAPADPSADSFSAGLASVQSSATTTLTWSARNARGVNLQYACVEDIALYDAQGIRRYCNSALFTSATTSSSTALRIVNTGTIPRLVRLLILPQRADGSYVIASNRDITLTVLPAGMSVSSQTTTTAASTPKPSTTQPQGGSTAKMHAPITVGLVKGMRHAQVTILQTFLAQDAAIYPEASVSGYFGPATELAVKRFQKRYGIAKEGSVGFGTVGPGTRAKINVLVKP